MRARSWVQETDRREMRGKCFRYYDVPSDQRSLPSFKMTILFFIFCSRYQTCCFRSIMLYVYMWRFRSMMGVLVPGAKTCSAPVHYSTISCIGSFGRSGFGIKSKKQGIIIQNIGTTIFRRACFVVGGTVWYAYEGEESPRWLVMVTNAWTLSEWKEPCVILFPKKALFL